MAPSSSSHAFENNGGVVRYFCLVFSATIVTILFVIMPSSRLLAPSLRTNDPPAATSIKLAVPSNTNSTLEDYSFAVISTVEGVTSPWQSILKYGKLIKSSDESKKYDIAWSESIVLSSNLNSNNKALLFTDLIAYCGKLYSADKATGVLYELFQNHLIPRHILMSGDGMNSDVFESSWSATKSGILYIGSTGQLNPLRSPTTTSPSKQKSSWIKIVDPSARVNHVNWEKEYLALNRAVHPSTTLRHEAALWSELKHVWIFLPTSEMENLKYSTFSNSNTNYSLTTTLSILICTSDFRSIDTRHFENLVLPNYKPADPLTHRTTLQINSAKFLPSSDDNTIVSLLNLKETPIEYPLKGISRSFLMIFSLNGLITQPLEEIPVNTATAGLIPSSSQENSALITSTGIEFL